MNKHQLFDLIGEVNEDYVLAADRPVKHARPRWQTFAACAACAALIVGAYPAYRALRPQPLHGYTVVEGGSLTTQGDIKAPGTGDTPIVPGGAYIGGDSGEPDLDGERYEPAWLGAPSQETAQAQYDGLLRGLGLYPYGSPSQDPEWHGGAWIDNSYYPEAKLTVAIVDGFRTPELEQQIAEWCGGEVVFVDAKYSSAYLDSLMGPVSAILDGTGLFCGIGVDVIHNCLGVDLYGDPVPDSVLAELARLDPNGDAIRVRVFTQAMSTLTDDIVKGPPAPGEPGSEFVASEARATPGLDE